AVNPDSGQVEPADQLSNRIEVARHLKAMAQSVYGIELTPESSDEDYARAALAYNRGFMYQRAGADYPQSPYVMNDLNAEHDDMAFPNGVAEPPSTRGREN